MDRKISQSLTQNMGAFGSTVAAAITTSTFIASEAQDCGAWRVLHRVDDRMPAAEFRSIAVVSTIPVMWST